MSLFSGLRPFGVKKSPSSRLSGCARTCSAASPLWTLGDLRISMSESIRRNRGLAKDLFAATECRCRNIRLRQWLGATSLKMGIAGDHGLWGRIFRGGSRAWRSGEIVVASSDKASRDARPFGRAMATRRSRSRRAPRVPLDRFAEARDDGRGSTQVQVACLMTFRAEKARRTAERGWLPSRQRRGSDREYADRLTGRARV